MDQLASAFGRAKLLPRTMTALIGGAVFLATAWAGGVWWVAITVILALLAAVEYAGLHPQVAGAQKGVPTGAVLAVLLAAAGFWTDQVLLMLGAVVLLAGVGPWIVLGMDPHRWRQPAMLILIQGIAYVGVPLGVLSRWRLQGTFDEILWLFVIVWACDIAAYFVGLLFGRHKMAPKVSPGKSWEGAIAGLGAGGITGLLAGPIFGLGVPGAIALGAITSIAGQIGDLFESALKRRAGVKDSGGLLPGHGGVLDRFDAVLFAAPVAYLALRLSGRI